MSIRGDKIAVKTAAHQISYHELNRFANRIANTILSDRGKTQEPIALLVDQGISLIAAIVGILKADKIYLPLDIHDPPDRISWFLRESCCSHVITDAKNHALTTTVARSTNVGVLNLDEFNFPVSEENPSFTVAPGSYAYIFYTSGSTGKPKGVVDTHRNVLHNIMRYTNTLNVSADDRLTLLQSANFSGSVSSLFCSLLNGATVYPYDISKEGLGKNIASWLKNEHITMYHSVPAIFRSFLKDEEYFPDVRVIRLEGDAASVQDAALFKKHFTDDCLLVNGLGATETGIVRQYFVGKNSVVAEGILPIGYAVEDMEMFIVDGEGKHLPFHHAGEIAVRSKYLASGYWRDEAKTSSAFVPDIADQSVRTYRTGDLGKMSHDGCVAYLGRKDFQLKIRGNRVDPAEIESHLLKLPEVKDAVTATTLSQRGDGVLVAYIVPHGKPFPTPSYLRRRLKESLPEYMIPSRFILLDAFPLNANLKVDRKALPEPDRINRFPPAHFQPPRDSLEASLIELWETIFKISPIGINDNFFDLGGDSLFAAELFTQVEKRYGKELDMRTLLQYPTVEAFAKFIAGSKWTDDHSLVPLQPLGSRIPLFSIHGHQGHVHAYIPLARIIGTDQPLYGLQSIGRVNNGASLLTIEATAELYIKKIKTVQPNGPYAVAGFCYGGVIALEMAHQLVRMGEKVAHLIMFDVTPAEFANLLPAEILRRYQNHLKRERRRRFISGLEGLRHLDKLQTVLQSVQRNVIRLSNIFLARQRRNFPLPFPGHVTLFLSRETTASYTDDPSSVWSVLSTAGVEIVLCSGEEGVMFSEPHVQVLAKELNCVLSD